MKVEIVNDKVVIDGTTYVKEGQSVKAEQLDGMDYVIVRTYSAGVFAGYLKERNGKEATILQARRLWHWYGAASLSQLAVDGTSAPDKCKFPITVDQIEVTEVIEVLSVTKKAQKSIIEVPIWEV